MMVPLAWRSSALALASLLAACSSDEGLRRPDEFHTSGSREADQRAEQRILKDEQLHSSADEAGPGEHRPIPLYERLGGDAGVERIVSEFVDRALVDPRANWHRTSVKSGGFLGLGGKSAEWAGDPEQVRLLKEHLVQFVAVASGGPPAYAGRDLKTVHKGMRITNAEFDATIGALKVSLDNLEVGLTEQKELLALFESARPQVATKR